MGLRCREVLGKGDLMKCFVFSLALALGGVVAFADDGGAQQQLLDDLRKAEDRYLTATRARVSQAAKIRVIELTGVVDRGEEDPFENKNKQEEPTFRDPQQRSLYTAGKQWLLVDKDSITSFALGLIPVKRRGFAMNMRRPGYGIEFLDKDGHVFFSCTLCLESHSTEISYVYYNDRLGVDLDRLKPILAKAKKLPDED